MATALKKMMLIGESKVGKTSLIEALTGEKFNTGKAMAIEFCGDYIDTPGEFLENRRFYPALITTSAEVKVVALIQDATRISCLFPPQFASIFSRDVVGIITKTDAENANIERAERFLKSAGAKDIIKMSLATGEGLLELKEKYL